jgi:hypothetical protein
VTSSTLERVLMNTDFRTRFISLLSYRFREFGSILGLQVLEAVNGGANDAEGRGNLNIVTLNLG